jgi:hypothetical protein
MLVEPYDHSPEPVPLGTEHVFWRDWLRPISDPVPDGTEVRGWVSFSTNMLCLAAQGAMFPLGVGSSLRRIEGKALALRSVA